MKNIKELIFKNKPNLTPSSIKTYLSTLKSIYSKVFNSDDYLLTNFNNTEKVLEHIKDIPASRRKSVLSSLVVLTGNEKYKSEMLSCISQHNQVVSKQEKTEKQKANDITQEELKDIYDDLVNEAKMIYKKKKINDKDIQTLQSYILISLMNGEFIPPRRSTDWCEFKLYNINDDKCNYMDKNQFVFNTFKNSNTKGQQKIDVPIDLKNIIEKYRKVSENEYLLYDLNGTKMNSTKITQKFNKILGRKASTNSMRHLFLSSKYSGLIETKKELAADMKAMGSSAEQECVYVQK